MTTQMSAHVSAAHAARMYGRSEKTVRRWITSGKLPAEKVDGVYLVSTMAMAELVGDVSAPMTAHVSTPGTDSMSTQGADTDVRPDDEGVRPSESPGTDIMRAEAMAAYTRSLLEPLVAHVAELEGMVRDQAETIGALRARTETQSVELTTGAPTARSSSTAWLTPRRFWIIAVLVLVLIGVGVVQVTVALYSLAVQLAMPG